MTDGTEHTEVLVVGGSLVGLSAAVFLAGQDVTTVVVERHAGSSLHPRAIGYTTRTMELYRAFGVDVPPAKHFDGPPRRARVESLAGHWIEEYPWTPGRGGGRQSDLSPAHATAVAQDVLEPALRARASELGADLRPSTELVGLDQDDTGVTAHLRERSGRDHDLRAAFVVAADGAGSPVRDLLGIGRSGEGVLSVQRSILFRADLERHLAHGVVQFEIEQPDLEAFMTTYGDGRWVLMLGDDVDRDDHEQVRLVRQAIGDPDLDVDLVTQGRWELAALIADRFGDGRILLAGDAAHQLPPNRGGFGANTGIDDAHNLAWKLAAVVSGRSRPALLETYDAERRPVAWLRHEQIFARADYKAYLDTGRSTVPVIDDDAIELGQLYRSDAVVGADDDLPPARRPDEWCGQPGTRAPHLWVTQDGVERSVLDLFQHGWVLLSEDPRWDDAAREAAAALATDVDVVRVGAHVVPRDPASFRTLYGVDATGASLVRPDGYVAWRAVTAPAEPATELRDVLRGVAAAWEVEPAAPSS